MTEKMGYILSHVYASDLQQQFQIDYNSCFFFPILLQCVALKEERQGTCTFGTINLQHVQRLKTAASYPNPKKDGSNAIS